MPSLVKKRTPKISLDTETTGIDFRFGARPFFVTTCDEKGDIRFWEWDVDPTTREVQYDPADLHEILHLVYDGSAGLVLQNSKFDVTALSFAFGPANRISWPWDRTDDTLVAGHILASNRPHNLTDMGIRYLGVNIQEYEDRLEGIVQAARRWVRSNRPGWAIAKEGRPDMPSAKDKTWKFDTWLPRACWKESAEIRRYHPEWETALWDYANADSGITLPLWHVQWKEIQRRQLEGYYRERLKCMCLGYRLETSGVTLSRERLEAKKVEYRDDSEKAARVCVNIAASYGHELTLPKGGVNNSLREFCFDVMKLEGISGAKSKTGAPSLDKAVMSHYLLTLPERSRELTFIRTLLGKRARDTAVAYMEAYERFWVPVTDDSGDVICYRLHPFLNPTGSDTLRWTSSNPNEQNISKQESNVRVCFGPAPGREWWSLDAKNIELRLPFYESGEKSLIDLFERPDEPPYYGSNHLANFHAVYPDVWDAVQQEVGPEKVGPTCKKRFASTYYQWCKNGGFAKQYGGQRKKVDDTFHRPGAFDLLDSKFSNLAKLNRWCIAFANKHGYVETIPDRSIDPKKGYPLLCTRTDRGNVLETVPLSYRIQGSAMWWTHKAMDRCISQLDYWEVTEKFDGFMTMQVHDECVFDFPKKGDPVAEAKGEAPAGSSNLLRVRRLQELMAKGGDDYGIPTPVGCEYHAENWAEGVTL